VPPAQSYAGSVMDVGISRRVLSPKWRITGRPARASVPLTGGQAAKIKGPGPASAQNIVAIQAHLQIGERRVNRPRTVGSSHAGNRPAKPSSYPVRQGDREAAERSRGGT